MQLEAEQPTAAPPVDKSGQRVRKMFGEIAGRYDLLNHLLSLNVDKYWRRKAVRAAPPAGVAPVLDVCTGTGDLALAYCKASQDGAPIIGTDFCHEMLEIGRRKAERRGLSGRVSFVEADTLALPFPDDEFQIVSVAFGLRNVSDTQRGLREMTRVCRPGGRVVILEFSLPEREPFRGVYRWYFHRVLPRIGQALARNRQSAYNYLPESVEEFPSGRDLTRLMQAAGLRRVTFRPLTLGIATLYVGVK